MDEDMKERGIEVIIQSAKIDTGFGKVLERRGYMPSNVEYIKRIN